MGKRLTLVLVALSLLVAACGSTSEKADSSAQSTDKADTAGKTGGSDGTTATGEVAGDTGSTAGGAAGTSSAGKGNGTGTSGTGSSAKVASGPAKVSPGVTDKEILIGSIYAENAGAANAAFGYGGIGQIDSRKVQDAVIADINKRGGVGGRKIKPIYYKVDGTDFSTTTDTHEQRACATWSEDNKVFAAFGAGDVLNACLAKKGIPQIVSIGGGDTTEFKKYPKLFSVAGAATDRVAKFVVDRLSDRGYYKGAKLGLMIYTQPTYVRASKVMLDELEKKGVKPAQIANIKPRDNVVGANDEIAAIRSAVLKFKTENITHVQFISDSSAWVELHFMKAANEQAYFPRYGLNSNDGGQALATLLGADAHNQLARSIGVGWFPLFDVRAQDIADSPALTNCKKVAREAGQEFSDPTRNTEAQAAGLCDVLYFLDAAVEAGLPDITFDSFKLGAESLKSFAAANTFKSGFSADRHDGVSSIRMTEWFQDCDCFKYTSPEQRI